MTLLTLKPAIKGTIFVLSCNYFSGQYWTTYTSLVLIKSFMLVLNFIPIQFNYWVVPSACPARYYVNCVDLHYTSRIKSTFVKRELSLKIEQIQYDTYSSISYVIDLNHHLALSPLISPPYILNFGCQPYSIIGNLK